MKQFNIIVPDKVGALAEICSCLNDVNILALATEVHEDSKTGTIKVISGSEDDTRAALKSTGFEFTENYPLIVNVIDQPGQLSNFTQELAEANVNIRSLFLLDRGLFALTVAPKDLDKAKQILGDRIISE